MRIEKKNLMRLGVAAAIFLVVAVILELALFNYHHWETYGLYPQAKQELNGEVSVFDGSHTQISYDLDNVEVSSVSFEIDDPDPYFPVKTRVLLKDSTSAHELYPLADSDVYSNGRVYMKVHVYGYAKQIVVEADKECTISGVVLNDTFPLDVSPWRIAFVFFLLLGIYALRPSGVLHDTEISDKGILPKVSVAVATLICFVVVIGTYNGPHGDRFFTNQYNKLASAIVNTGSFALEEEPTPYLAEMDQVGDPNRLLGEDNILDRSARESHQTEGVPHYNLDYVYRDGHYYVYFGVVPVLTAYVPYHIIKGNDLWDGWSCLAALLAIVVLTALLLYSAARRWFPKASISTLLIAYIMALIGSAILYSVARPMFYNVPVLFALDFALLGLLCALWGYNAGNSIKRCLLYVVAGASTALIIGCRPQVIVMGLPLILVVVFMARKKEFKPVLGKVSLACAVIPFIAVVFALLYYNHIRFGGWLDFGASYNLTGNDMTQRGHEIARGIDGIFFYLISTCDLNTAVPFYACRFTLYGSATNSQIVCENYTMGYFALFAPMLLSFAFLFIGNMRERIVMGACLALSVIIVVFDMQGAGLVARYMQDFGMIISLGCAYCFLSVMSDPSRQNGLLYKSAIALCIVSLFVMIANGLTLDIEVLRDILPDQVEQYGVQLSNAANQLCFWGSYTAV